MVVLLRQRKVDVGPEGTLELASLPLDILLSRLDSHGIHVDGPLDAFVRHLVNYLDKIAPLLDIHGPTEHATKFGPFQAIPRCHLCLASPTSSRLAQKIHADMGTATRWVQTITRLAKKVNYSNWLESHISQHFACCGEPLPTETHWLQHQIRVHWLSPSLNLPKLPWNRLLECVERIVSAMDEVVQDGGSEVSTFETKLKKFLSEARSLDSGVCHVCRRSSSQGHDGRVCSLEIRQKAFKLLAQVSDPDKYTLRVLNRSRKLHDWLPFSPEFADGAREAFRADSTRFSIVVACARMIVTLTSLRCYDHALVPVGDWQFWLLAMQVVSGLVHRNSPPPTFKMEDDDPEDIAHIQDASTFSWYRWRQELIDTWDALGPDLDRFALHLVTPGILVREAKKTATNFGTKMRTQLAPTIWKYIAGKVSWIKYYSPWCRVKGRSGKIMAAMKRLLLSNQDPSRLSVAEILGINDSDLDSVQDDVEDIDELESVEKEKVFDPQEIDWTIRQLRAVLDDVRECLRGVPLSRLVDPRQKGEARLPKPPTPLLVWRDRLVRQKLQGVTDQAKRQAIESRVLKECTDSKFVASSSEAERTQLERKYQEDLQTWETADAMLGQGLPVAAPEYSYSTRSYTKWSRNHKLWRKVFPSYMKAQDGKRRVEWVGEPFKPGTSTSPSTVTRDGVTSSIIWRVFICVLNLSYLYNQEVEGVFPRSQKKDTMDRRIKNQWDKACRLSTYGLDTWLRSWNTSYDEIPLLSPPEPLPSVPKPRLVKMTEPVMSISFAPQHATYDWPAIRFFFEKHLDLKLSPAPEWQSINDWTRLPFLFVKPTEAEKGRNRARRIKKKWRTSVRGPLTTVTRITALETDGFDCVLKVQTVKLVAKEDLIDLEEERIDQDSTGVFDLTTDSGRETIRQARESGQCIEAFGDPGFRDIEKWIFPLTLDQKDAMLRDPRLWSPLDQGIISMDLSGSVTLHKFDQVSKRVKPTIFAPQKRQTAATTITGLIPGSTFLLRNLSLSVWRQRVGYTTRAKERSRLAKLVPIGFDKSPAEVYGALPTQKSASYTHLHECYAKWLDNMDLLLGFEHGYDPTDFGFRPSALRIFHRRKQVVLATVDDLFTDPRTGRVADPQRFILYHGDAKFATTMRGLGSSPGNGLRGLFRSHCWYCPIGEYHTSKICCVCRVEELSDKSPGWNRATVGKGKVRLPHGVKFCSKCRVHVNRDFSACLNMAHVALSLVYLGRRPQNFFSCK